jgi:alginate O-acetyltransferase complex protein AlgJ
MPRARHQGLRPLLALMGIAFFFAPLAAFLGGERAESIENRPLAKFPDLSSGFSAFDQLTRWGVDHLTLRDSAVRLNSSLSRNLLGEAPSTGQVSGPVGIGAAGRLAGAELARPGGSRIVIGDGDWLFLSQEFSRACDPGRPPAEVIEAARRLGAIITRSGRRFVIAVAPDKSSVLPDRVPEDYALRDCAERSRRERLAALRAARLPGFVDLQALLEEKQRSQGRPIYLKGDTHWTDAGAVVMARSLAAAVDPRLLAGTRVERGPDHRRVEDLAFQIGDGTVRSQLRLDVVRRGVRVGPLEPAPAFPGGRAVRSHARAAAGGARLYRGKAVVYGDSFAEHSLEQFTPFFADVTLFSTLASAETNSVAVARKTLITRILNSQLVVFVTAERGFWTRERASVLDTAFLNRLETRLGGGL